MRDKGGTEIGGFGISSRKHPLVIEDFVLVRQEAHVAFVEFDDTAVADYFEDQFDRGLQPLEYGRIWIHTHPGDSAQPSGVDYQTFERVFGACDWAVMFILAKGGDTFASLRFGGGLHVAQSLPVSVTYDYEFPGTDAAGWEQEYKKNVTAHEHTGYGGGLWGVQNSWIPSHPGASASGPLPVCRACNDRFSGTPSETVCPTCWDDFVNSRAVTIEEYLAELGGYPVIGEVEEAEEVPGAAAPAFKPLCEQCNQRYEAVPDAPVGMYLCPQCAGALT